MKTVLQPFVWVLLAIKRTLGRVYRYIFHGPVWQQITRIIPFWKPIYYTKGNESAVSFRLWFFQKVLGFNKYCYWPVHFTSTVSMPKNIYVGIDAAPGISPGCYIQAVGKIYIGDYTQIAPNVGIISSNHFMLDIRQHIKSEVRIGEYCRIGMGSLILPGVVLGDFTTVSAGSVVTKSFPQGYCVLAGNPAQIVADYSTNDNIKEKFIRYKNKFEYNGYIPHHKFEAFRKKNLYV
jgi:acetyltransferase-like isoleucine patch superfamily enzyme